MKGVWEECENEDGEEEESIAKIGVEWHCKIEGLGGDVKATICAGCLELLAGLFVALARKQ